MKHLPKRNIVAGLLLAAATVTLYSQQIQISKENRTIAITTSDDASAVADLAQISIGFTQYGKDHDALYADASKASNAIVNSLLAAGVPKQAIQSASQGLREINPGNDDDKARYNEGIRFAFSQQWEVTVPADQAAKALQVAITSGANESGAISWQLKDDNQLQAEAAKKALEHARQIADEMALGLHAKLGPLVYASNQTPPRGIFANSGFAGVTLNTESASVSAVRYKSVPLALSPQKITRSATVYAVFAID